jgi:signal transduction histidine kinase
LIASVRGLRGRRRRLRFRVTAAFSLGALLLASGISITTLVLARRYLVSQRETSAVRQARANARLVQSRLREPDPDIPRLLTSLAAPARSSSVLYREGEWFAADALVGRDALPVPMQQVVVDDRVPATQRYHAAGGTTLAVGIPLGGRAAYFEVSRLVELDRTLATLRNSLLLASAVLVVGSFGLAVWASRRILTPVAEIGRAATAIAGGQLDARLDAGGDDELFALATSFNAMVDTLQRRIERDARFASDVSHELRSPLTTLRSAVQVMEARRSGLEPRAARELDLLAAEVRRFDDLVRDLLEISRYDAGAAAVDRSVVPLAALVADVLASEGVDVGVDGVFVAPADPLLVDVDPRRLGQALANVVRNASVHAGGVCHVRVEADGDFARVLVDDAGPGVAVDERARVFERFARGRAAGRRSSGGGVGLGLALAAEHLALQGGRIWVEDAPSPDGGARFVLEVRRAAPAP